MINEPRPFQYGDGGVKERINLDPTAEWWYSAQEIAKQRPELGAFPQKVKDYLAEHANGGGAGIGVAIFVSVLPNNTLTTSRVNKSCV